MTKKDQVIGEPCLQAGDCYESSSESMLLKNEIVDDSMIIIMIARDTAQNYSLPLRQ